MSEVTFEVFAERLAISQAAELRTAIEGELTFAVVWNNSINFTLYGINGAIHELETYIRTDSAGRALSRTEAIEITRELADHAVQERGF